MDEKLSVVHVVIDDKGDFSKAIHARVDGVASLDFLAKQYIVSSEE
jgi:hypothetical protein